MENQTKVYDASSKPNKNFYNKCYLISLLLCAAFGTVQFGWSLGAWNVTFVPYGEVSGWDFDGDEATNKQTLIQSITTLGSAIGAMFSGPFLAIGRWRCLILGHLLCIVAGILSLIMNFPCLLIGRFIYGLAAGAFSVFCPKYIAEVSPVELRGETGSLTQLGVTLGIMVCFFAGWITTPETIEEKQFFVDVMFGIPIVISIVNIALLVIVFPYDTPPMLFKNGNEEKL